MDRAVRLGTIEKKEGRKDVKVKQEYDSSLTAITLNIRLFKKTTFYLQSRRQL